MIYGTPLGFNSLLDEVSSYCLTLYSTNDKRLLEQKKIMPRSENETLNSTANSRDYTHTKNQ